MSQLSICGAVSNWCEQFGLTEEEKGQERTLDKGESVNKGMLKREFTRSELLVFSRMIEPTSGNRLRENIQEFESLPQTVQFTNVCELASFWYRVSAGMSYHAKPDEDDGFGDPIPVCREYTLPGANPLPIAYATIPGENNHWTSH